MRRRGSAWPSNREAGAPSSTWRAMSACRLHPPGRGNAEEGSPPALASRCPMPRARLLGTVAAAAWFAAALSAPSSAQTLPVAMTASDTPTTTGIPNNGGEGFRFCGFPAFDGLIDWDFTHPEGIAGLTPGLASEWKIDDGDHTRWIFTLRDDV